MYVQSLSHTDTHAEGKLQGHYTLHAVVSQAHTPLSDSFLLVVDYVGGVAVVVFDTQIIRCAWKTFTSVAF